MRTSLFCLLLLLGVGCPPGDDDDSSPGDDAADDDDADPTDVVGSWTGTFAVLQYGAKSEPPDEVCSGPATFEVDSAGALTGSGGCDVDGAGTVTATLVGAVDDLAGGSAGGDATTGNANDSWGSQFSGEVPLGGPAELEWGGWVVHDNGFWASAEFAITALPN